MAQPHLLKLRQAIQRVRFRTLISFQSRSALTYFFCFRSLHLMKPSLRLLTRLQGLSGADLSSVSVIFVLRATLSTLHIGSIKTPTTGVSEAAESTLISNDAEGSCTVASDGSDIVFGPTAVQTFADVLALEIIATFNIPSGAKNGQVGDISFENFEIINFDFMVCFLRGTRIRTPLGERPIETLHEGDLVDTVDAGLRPVQWVGSTADLGREKNVPIRFEVNSIGNKAEMYLSPNHKVALNHPFAELHFGVRTVLLPAKAFANGRTIIQVQRARVEYFHLVLEKHHVAFAEGAECETLLFGDMSERTLLEAHRAELIRRRFGQIETWKNQARRSSFVCLTVTESKMLLSSIAAARGRERDMRKTPECSMAPLVH